MRRIGYPIFEIALVALLFVAAAIGLGSVFFFRFSSDNEDTQDNIIRMSDSSCRDVKISRVRVDLRLKTDRRPG